MSTRCMPRQPLKCWQYRKGSDEPIPRWVAPWIMAQADGRLDFVWPDNGGQTPIDDLGWIVLLDDGANTDPACAWYQDEEFQAQFEVRP